MTSSVLAAACAVALLAQPPAGPGNAKGKAKAVGEALFERECASCHIAGSDSRAPSLQALRGLEPGAVVTALSTGKMSAQAQRLSPADRIAVAEFVTGRVTAVVNETSTTAQCPATAKLQDSFGKPSWNGWGAGLENTRYSKAGGISGAQVPRLKLAWAFGFPRALAARTQPTVIGDWLFTGSDTGDVFALNARSGCVRWTYKARAGVRTAMTVLRLGGNRFGVYFGDGQSNAYGLDAQTGSELWVRKVETHPNATITGAPAVHQGRVYVPTSAAGEEVRGQDPTYACCSFRGSVSALDAASGELIWKSYTIQPEPRPRGKSAKGVELLGPAGAGTWGSPTIDVSRGVLYIGTGNGYAGPQQNTMNAIIAMDLKTGAHVWVQQTVPNDIWLYQCESQRGGQAKQPNANCPDEEGPDFDFATSPLITRTAAGRDFLIVPQKSGVMYAMDPNRKGEVVWQYRYGQGSALGGQWGAASDGRNAYVGTGDTLSPQPGGMHAVDLATGKRAWYTPPPSPLCSGGAEQRCFPAQGGAVTAIPGAVFSAGADGGLRAYASANGNLLWTFDTNRPFQTVNGVAANGATMDAGGAVVAGGMLFVNSGYNGIVGRAGNVLLAFRVE